MITVKLKNDLSGAVNGFMVSGHSGYGEKGSDIVCAGVSALIETTALALEAILKIPVEAAMDPETGYLECAWTNEFQKFEKVDLLIQTMLLGLAKIREQYPQYIEVLEVEV